MSRRVGTIVFAVGVVVFASLILMFAVRNKPSVDENNSSQIEPPMTLINQQFQSTTEAPYPEHLIVELLSFENYEVGAKNDLSLCKEDWECLKETVGIVGASCVSDICYASNSTKNPLDCLVSPTGTKEIIQGDQKALASSLCAIFRSPDDPLRRKEFLHHASSDAWVCEDELVEFVAHFLALKVSGEACINYVKDYVGPYGGPKWKFRWYRVLAGCRILSNDTSCTEQENNLTIWYRWRLCPYITDLELRKACEAVAGDLTVKEGRFSDK